MRSMLTCLDKRAAALVAALALTAPWLAAHAADVSQARVWADATHTRVVLVASGPLDYRITQTGGRMVVDLGDSQLVGGFGTPSAQGLFYGMTTARQGNRLQLTAAVDPASRMKSFVLKPISGSDYRLVIDLYPGNASTAAVSAAKPPMAAAAASARDTSAQTLATVREPSLPTQTSVRETPPPATEIAADMAPADEPVTVASEPVVVPARSRMVASRQAAALLGGQRKVVIAVDAGHGGKDSGAHGAGGTQEKDVTLAVARELAAQINRQPGMKAVLTRSGDMFIPLKQRYQIARDNSADLFVSIHADSFTSSDARGSSVWVLSPRGKTNAAARWLADGQNRADLIGGVTLDDKDDGLAKVLLDLQQGYAMQASDAVAGNVLKALQGLGPTHRGYVERANFVVLRSPDVPSILVETAFISNPAEEHKLRDPAHQRQLATAVMGGVRDYFEATPPPGSWFAAQAAASSGVMVASAAPVASKPRSASAARKPMTLARATTAASASDSVQDVHKVGRGESLRSIARQYGISVGVLKSANGMRNDTVRAGAMLTIPTG